MLVTLMPGMACEMASPVKNSSSVSHLRLWTNSRSSQPLRPPPKLVNPIRLKIKNSCGELVRLEEASSMGGPILDHRLRALTSPARPIFLAPARIPLASVVCNFSGATHSPTRSAGDVHLGPREQAMEEHYDTSAAPISAPRSGRCRAARPATHRKGSKLRSASCQQRTTCQKCLKPLK